MLPRIQPIIPTRRRKPFDDPDWLFEFKYDGFRGLWYFDRGRARLISRDGNLMSRFDALADQVAASLGVGEAHLDGEVMVSDATGRPQFYDLLLGTRRPTYVAFDILWLNGRSASAAGGCKQYCRRSKIFRRRPGYELFILMCAQDLDGIVAKRLHCPYDARVRRLQIKNPDYSQLGWQRRAVQ